MSEASSSRRTPVRVLRDSVARRIAAGEVIERPASVVRELLDNSLDAGSREISVHLEEGGVSRIRVVDDGFGMTEEDLRLCWLPHATSKIETEDDLYRVKSLGFRGEALASIATVARVEITSLAAESDTAYSLKVHGGDVLSFGPAKGRRGTVVDVADLFYSVPARKKFLKRASAETAQCRTVFLEKALPFPEVAFKLFIDGELRQFLPPTDLPGRAAAAYPDDLPLKFLKSLSASGEGFSLELAAATQEIARRDRKLLQIFVNRRRIWDYTLAQGVEYAYSSYLPGGLLPACFVFVDLDPSLVDFNIHPAKKEAKIKNLQDLRRRIVEVLGSFLREATKTSFSLPRSVAEYKPAPLFDAGRDAAGSPNPAYRLQPETDLRLRETPLPSAFSAEGGPKYDFIYRGQVFGLFLLAERGDRLFLVDQHAAHERILYETFAADTLPQELLVPEEFETDEETDAEVEKNSGLVRGLGVRIERLGARRWALTALPETFRGAEGDVVEAVTAGGGAAETLKKDIFARAACRKAVKDGDPLGPAAACELIAKAFALENPRCPHGRPIWFELSREELFRCVGRLF